MPPSSDVVHLQRVLYGLPMNPVELLIFAAAWELWRGPWGQSHALLLAVAEILAAGDRRSRE